MSPSRQGKGPCFDVEVYHKWRRPLGRQLVATGQSLTRVLYYGAQVLLKPTDGGMSWTASSPDPTHNDKSKQQISGGPITKDHAGTEYYDTIFSESESPVEAFLSPI